MKLRAFSVILLVLCSLPHNTFAVVEKSPLCSQALKKNVEDWEKALYAKPKRNVDYNTPEMLGLAKRFLEENPFILEGRSLSMDEIVLKKVEIRYAHPKYSEVQIYYDIPAYSEQIKYNQNIRARTNGRAMFIDESFEYSQAENFNQKMNVVYFNSKNEIEVADQTELIFKTLPENVTLSRVMSKGEFNLWKNGGDLTLLNSRGVGGGTRAKIAPRTTFALNYFEFGGDKPVQVSIPKKVLEKLLKKKKLVINTYNSINDSYQGMKKEALTSFGLEVEVVVLGNIGRLEIQPYMANPVSVPAEFPIVLLRKYKFIPPRSVSRKDAKKWIEERMMKAYLKEIEDGIQAP